ncbi:hypothetical protein SAMN02745866_02090 [Alteromonadaceae bacterium Bs31]|nr:hypothetical protein SAMN02745866_02090 [Alteromonadaceae bacterium Bs31]
MKKLLSVAWFALFFPCMASAGLVDISGGFTADLSTYTERHLPGMADPWPDTGEVFINPIINLSSNAKFEVIYRGGSNDAWLLGFPGAEAFSFKHKHLSNDAPGASISGLSAQEFTSFLISNEAMGVGLSDIVYHSLAIQQIGNVLEIGWNGTSSSKDYGYQRFKVVASTPIPATLPMVGIPLILLLVIRRRWLT